VQLAKDVPESVANLAVEQAALVSALLVGVRHGELAVDDARADRA